MPEIAFESLAMRHRGETATVVGRGPTRFDYRKLSKEPGPVFFINDAVQLEKHLRLRQVSYFFFLENAVASYWLPQKLRSIIMCPTPLEQLAEPHPDNTVCGYIRTRQWTEPDRSQTAQSKQLYIHNGTITPLLHFVWYTGCRRVRFIGCDGLNQRDLVKAIAGTETGYDARVANRSGTAPGWIYSLIRHSQDQMLEKLGIKATYIGTPKLGGEKPVMFCSYATPRYEKMLERLNASACYEGIETHFEAVKDRGDWGSNTHLKPRFMMEMRRIYPIHRLVWLDADAVIRQFPALFYDLPDDVDVAAAYRRGCELLSGTVYFAPNKRADLLLECWAHLCETQPEVWDQQLLAKAIMLTGIRFQELPPAYTFIYDIFRREHPGVEPVIEHYQASRQMR